MKPVRLLLLLAALGICAWLALRQSESATEPSVPAGDGSGGALPNSAAEVQREAEKLRDTAQQVPCRPGDPLCAPSAP